MGNNDDDHDAEAEQGSPPASASGAENVPVLSLKGSVYRDPGHGWCFVLAEVMDRLPQYRLLVRRTGFRSAEQAREQMHLAVPPGSQLEERIEEE